MDVHAPHQPVHTWRDFFTHLTIVTIGLFIALTLEAFVEYLHHRHLVHEARENIRQEIEHNHEAAQKDLVLLQRNVDSQEANIKAIHALMADPKNFHGSIDNSMNFDSLNDAAWRTARDTGALGFMPYDEVQRYSDLYMLEDLVNKNVIAAGVQDFDAISSFKMGYDPGSLPADEYVLLLRKNASIQIQFTTLKEFVQQFDDHCVAELKR
ncbi:hypothetical protein [Granulicella mallensis]|uniref:Uncharacterized protein n=1 Tax=Granulicella mallensis (strain ATCC BAA-1857 / DSM 23137 / MP5ACTX8) TaxID=682795 RepID=G8NNK1_GRAMM|nr:hypothetical protein [Granulicella mallensis]AEU34786.1 hypothetical protein AciX8_0433 [Granulicella mallensis MP5ACTX8]